MYKSNQIKMNQATENNDQNNKSVEVWVPYDSILKIGDIVTIDNPPIAALNNQCGIIRAINRDTGKVLLQLGPRSTRVDIFNVTKVQDE